MIVIRIKTNGSHEICDDLLITYENFFERNLEVQLKDTREFKILDTHEKTEYIDKILTQNISNIVKEKTSEDKTRKKKIERFEELIGMYQETEEHCSGCGERRASYMKKAKDDILKFRNKNLDIKEIRERTLPKFRDYMPNDGTNGIATGLSMFN